MEMTFRPLAAWPGAATKRRKRAPFRAGYNATLKLLDAELRHLKAAAVVLQVALREDEIRLDGRPRAGSRPSHPGVVLSFESAHGPLSYPCDAFEDWEDNLRAIALSLEHLRAVDRYGVTKRGEQYRGWTALPPPPTPAAAAMTPTAAAVFLHEHSGRMPITGAEERKAAYRAAAMKLHPDRGGDAALFASLQKAREVLGL